MLRLLLCLASLLTACDSGSESKGDFSCSGACLCAEGETCNIDCDDSDTCAVRIEANATATVNCASGACSVECDEGATCDVIAGDGATSVECNSGATCTETCGDSTCGMTCNEAESCTQECAGSGVCSCEGCDE